MRALTNPRISSYCARRKSYFSGKLIKHWCFWSDYILRLFRRDCGHFLGSLVHEAVVLDEPTTKLDNPLEHHPYSSVSELIKKSRRVLRVGRTGNESKR